MMKKRRFLPIAAIAAVALVAAACGGGGDDDAMVDDGGDMTTPPAPTAQPVDVTMPLALSAAAQALMKAELDMAGESDTVEIAANGTATRRGVVFTCDSDYPCTVTVTNSLGTIVAEWSSQRLPSGTANVMAALPASMDPLVELNDGSGSSVAGILRQAIGSAGTAPTPDGARDNSDTTIGGLDMDGIGAANDDMVSLTSSLDPNQDPHDAAADLATGGSTLNASGDDNDNVTTNAGTVAQANWDHKVLFRDWGDTGTGGDGGFETGALIYSNIDAPTSHPFDAMLALRFANEAVRSWYTLAPTADDMDAATAMAVIIGANAVQAQLSSISFNVQGSQLEATELTMQDGDAANGMYMGIPGSIRCTTTAGCPIARSETGTTSFGIEDTDAATAGIQSGSTWEFTPAPGAMVTVPDQDWMVFGAWATIPDDEANGEHRVGVFFDGMDEYVYGDGSALTGSATYSGSAAGVYVEPGATGLFTARAMLTANFTTTTNPDTLTGRIDNFKNTAGRYLGEDTVANPNDPVSGGENDWFVDLDRFGINDAGSTDVDGANNGGVSGSADGVTWTGGEWSAQLYGPGNGTATTPPTMQPQPSGVAGQFRAISGMDSTTRAVVGAFGAERQMPASN